jgi:enterochelin esterase-like enzyme
LLEDEIIKYLIPYIDQNYSTAEGKRLILGWSAGGFGAMFLFSKHSSLFKAVFSLDSPILTWEDFVNFQGTRPAIVNNSEYYYEHCSPNEWMVRNRNVILEKKDTAIFITAGAGMLAPFHQDFLSILKEEEIPIHYREIACDHEFNCVFSESSDDLLIFLSKSLE